MVLEVNLIYFPTQPCQNMMLLQLEALWPFYSLLEGEGEVLVLVHLGGGEPILLLLGNESFLKLGMWVKCTLSSILHKMFDENCMICFVIYLRKLSLFHLPINLIVESSAPDNFIAIAPPERIEWVPISFAKKPKAFLSINFTVFLRKLTLSLFEML